MDWDCRGRGARRGDCRQLWQNDVFKPQFVHDVRLTPDNAVVCGRDVVSDRGDDLACHIDGGTAHNNSRGVLAGPQCDHR
jgi:hypothetical protein